ncbi:MAG: PilZ domain-containing protein [Terriglobia bacterium]|jgi:hypothetical protein
MPKDDENFRRDYRVTCTMRAPLATGPGSGEFIEDSSTMDLSESGVRIRLCGQIEPGQIVELFLSKNPEPCRVVWTTPAGANKELVAGLEFICPLPDPRRRQAPPSSHFEPIN